MKRLFVMAERLKSMTTPSRDEELTPLPAGKWFDNLKVAFEWADSSNLLGDLFGWQANVYLLTNKSFVQITKVTEQMIYENELHEALEGLKAAYYDTDAFTFQIAEGGYGRKKWEEMTKQKLNSLYGSTAAGRGSVPLNEDEINSASAASQRRKEQHGNPEQE